MKGWDIMEIKMIIKCQEKRFKRRNIDFLGAKFILLFLFYDPTFDHVFTEDEKLTVKL